LPAKRVRTQVKDKITDTEVDARLAGDHGRFRVKSGDVIFHGRFEAHLDRFSQTGAAVLNLTLPVRYSCTPGVARVADPDGIVRVAERSCLDAVDLLLSPILE
jgi:hypothetical protein